MFCNKLALYGEWLLAPRPTPTLEDHPLSFVRGCLFSIFTAGDRPFHPQPEDTPCCGDKGTWHLVVRIQKNVECHSCSPKYLGMTLDAKLKVETACEEKKGRTRTEIQKNVLANGSLFGPICM
jgi:hypothetical protein